MLQVPEGIRRLGVEITSSDNGFSIERHVNCGLEIHSLRTKATAENVQSYGVASSWQLGSTKT